MGRYTSVQGFSDQNTKTISSSSTSAPPGAPKAKLVTERVLNVHGSTAGASSSEFDVYRLGRRRELDRLNAMEQETRKAVVEELYVAKIERNRIEAEERTKKNAEKRKKKKMKKLFNKKKQKLSDGTANVADNEDSDEDADGEEGESVNNGEGDGGQSQDKGVPTGEEASKNES